MQYRQKASDIYEQLTSDYNERERPVSASVDEVRRMLRNQNPVRWWRLQRDVRWMKRMMKRKGINPEEFRWLL